ncbi:MAG: Spi family protease inhibitor, partial [Victivallales bacterium]|nr:Spi family protease inhibitor [Victivallales bacterium]
MNYMQNHWLSRLFLVCFAGFALSLCAKEVSEEEVLFAAGKWLEANTEFWRNVVPVVPNTAKRLTKADGEPLPLWIVSLTPGGYIVFSSDDSLPPVVAFNTNGEFGQAPEALSLLLARQGEIYQDALAAEKTRGDSAATENQELWNALL